MTRKKKEEKEERLFWKLRHALLNIAVKRKAGGEERRAHNGGR